MTAGGVFFVAVLVALPVVEFAGVIAAFSVLVAAVVFAVVGVVAVAAIVAAVIFVLTVADNRLESGFATACVLKVESYLVELSFAHYYHWRAGFVFLSHPNPSVGDLGCSFRCGVFR
jgi:hypothetical protein